MLDKPLLMLPHYDSSQTKPSITQVAFINNASLCAVLVQIWCFNLSEDSYYELPSQLVL